ncbi:SAICAR synthase-like protein [Pilatotrama ljubarskyi]|nr:SAICAR synthase-like protein [Pilatotrama ljubarskyi]
MSSPEKHIPLEAQVGGHAGVMTSEDGSLLIKPALPNEVAFYQSVATDPGFAPLRPYVPKFYGTLRLEGKVDESAPAPEEGAPIKVVEAPIEGEKDELIGPFGYAQSLVLENLSHSFSKPNILDIKLGTVLYDDTASEEKRARMEKTARETTSLETGVRLTGFQVYDLATGKAVNTPKSYGKSITAAELPDGMARFFPIAPDAPAPEAVAPGAAANDAEGDRPTQGTGLPADVLAPILESLREDIAEIRAALAEVHMRMVGGSLLIVYEADWEKARAGLQWLEEGGDEDEDEDEDDEDEEEEEEGKKRVGPPYVVKLIDFAHTKIVPGAGPDDGVLKGVDTVLRLLDGRIEQVKAAAASKGEKAA